MPWRIKRWILVHFYGYEIDKTAYIGLSYVFPNHLKMEKGAKIASFTMVVHLDKMVMGRNSSIGRNNWITGFPIGTDSRHFAHQTDRRCEFY